MRLFAHRLAIAIGAADVSGLLDSLSKTQWLDWMAYFEAEPWDESRADARSAIIAALLYNMNRGRGQAAKKVDDFMAHRPPRAVSTHNHLSALKASLMAHGKRVDRADVN